MSEIEKLVKLLDSLDGLQVDLKVGKESSLTVKGDLLKIIKVFGAIEMSDNDRDHANRHIANL